MSGPYSNGRDGVGRSIVLAVVAALVFAGLAFVAARSEPPVELPAVAVDPLSSTLGAPDSVVIVAPSELRSGWRYSIWTLSYYGDDAVVCVEVEGRRGYAAAERIGRDLVELGELVSIEDCSVEWILDGRVLPGADVGEAILYVSPSGGREVRARRV